MLIIDGNHLASRCRHTMQALTTSDGRQSGVICGVLVGVRYALSQAGYQWCDTTIAWDGGRAKWRLELYPEYKQRKFTSTPEEYQAYLAQIDALYYGMQHLGVRQVKTRGVEADDIISILANNLFELGTRATVYSGDKDFHQLLRIANILAPDKGWVTEQDCWKEWGVEDLSKITDIRAMIGDASDNIKGVPGIGKKRAPQVLEAMGGLVDFLPPAQKKWVDVARQHTDIIERNKTLMRLPMRWTDTKYEDAQILETMKQFENEPKIDGEAFALFARDWDLNTTLERIGK